MKKFIILVFSALLTVSAYSQTTDSEETESQESQSRAWYIMHQMNTAPLLLGLTQQLGRVVESPERNNSIWNGIEEGGTLELNITVEGDISGEIFVGFFEEPEWLSAPVQVRSFPASGVYTIESLPPGQFQIGAMIGSLPTAAALGVQQQWPEPVVIEKGKTASANILVSGDIQLQASRAYANIAAKDFFDDWNDLDVQNLLHGRVTGPDGQPVPFALVQIREYNPGAGGIAAPDCGTNEQGYYKYDGIKWPYTLGVIRYKLMPSVFGYSHQFLMYNHVFDECETVDFQFDNFPAGNSSIKGRVLDQNENPLKEFFIDIRTRMDWDVRNNPDDKYYTVTGYHLPFMSEDGSFELNNLPRGDYTARVIPFDTRVYGLDLGQDVVLEPGKVTNINLKVNSKNILYGRVLFEDGSPAVIKPEPWSGAKTSIRMAGGMFATGVADLDNEGYFAVKLSDREIEQLKTGEGRLIINVPTERERTSRTMGDFPFDLLAKDKSNAGVLKISGPEPEPKSTMGKPLPELEDLGIASLQDVNDRIVLVCFFDMEQRPSRNCILELNKKSQELESQEIEVSVIQASNIEQAKLDEWVKENRISFPVGMIKDDEVKTRANWGVKALPWLILTNNEHIVTEEGFSINELDEKIETMESEK